MTPAMPPASRRVPARPRRIQATGAFSWNWPFLSIIRGWATKKAFTPSTLSTAKSAKKRSLWLFLVFLVFLAALAVLGVLGEKQSFPLNSRTARHPDPRAPDGPGGPVAGRRL